MRRMLLVLAVGLVMAAMTAVTVSEAFATQGPLPRVECANHGFVVLTPVGFRGACAK